jgi:2-oxoglutarate dehydrogenase E1 component
MLRKFRKPVVFFMPKAMLKVGLTTIDELIGDSQFRNVIDDPTNPAPAGVTRLLLCSGKVYHTLIAARDTEKDADGRTVARTEKITDVAVVRVEQPYPFPAKEIESILAKYSAAKVVWVQEEPRNRGCWTFMQPRLNELLPPGKPVEYVGRDAAASPATGSHKMHDVEEAEITAAALARPAKPAVVVSPGVKPVVVK